MIFMKDCSRYREAKLTLPCTPRAAEFEPIYAIYVLTINYIILPLFRGFPLYNRNLFLFHCIIYYLYILQYLPQVKLQPFLL